MTLSAHLPLDPLDIGSAQVWFAAGAVVRWAVLKVMCRLLAAA